MRRRRYSIRTAIISLAVVTIVVACPLFDAASYALGVLFLGVVAIQIIFDLPRRSTDNTKDGSFKHPPWV